MKQYEDGLITNVQQARAIVRDFLSQEFQDKPWTIELGLPERDDRDNTWVVPLIADFPQLIRPDYVGQIRIDWVTGEIVHVTECEVIEKRMERARTRVEIPTADKSGSGRRRSKQDPPADLGCSIYLGESQKVLAGLPRDAAQLVITSPPYYNARPDYSEYVDYEEYLDELREVFSACHRVLSEGRFFIVNSSPVLQRRIARKYSSKRIPVPFDIHSVVSSLGFEFIDDIIWKKPEGAGWNTGRGRRFRADRQPLQYKPVPVTEYFVVYRKATRKLIDWNLKKHRDPQLIEDSKIEGDYFVTNVWEAAPASHPVHPAVFPSSLIKEFVRYYSFKEDTVLDPFAGIGTVGHAALDMGRKFLLVDSNQQYFETMVEDFTVRCRAKGRTLHTHNGETRVTLMPLWDYRQ